MGVCNSKSGPAWETHQGIERQLKRDEKRQAREVKLLLLGAGESGKSTILKQMKVIYASSFDDLERNSYRLIVFANLVDSVKVITDYMEFYHLSLDQELAQYIQLLDNAPSLEGQDPYPKNFLMPLKRLWCDEGFQKCYARGNEYAANESLPFWFGEPARQGQGIDRLFEPGYMPTDQDILRVRRKTTGIAEETFHIESWIYRVLDVGGQRSERKKWIHCFENVTAIIFLVAISGYDACLIEDKDSNQMTEALILFDSICNSSWFVKTSMILFLNKIDIFREKIRASPVSKFFPDYVGAQDDYKAASNFFKTRFVNLNRSSDREIYPNFTNATDTGLLKKVMASVTEYVTEE